MIRSRKIFTAQALNRKASLVAAAEDADAAQDDLLAVKYATELALLKETAGQGLFTVQLSIDEYLDLGVEITAFLERYGFTVTPAPPTGISIGWGLEPVINDTPATSPQIDSVTPATGSRLGGTLVTVKGQAFTGLVQINFTGTATVNPEWTTITGNEITFVTPPATTVGITGAGVAEFVIVNTVGTSVSETFTYT